MDKSIDQSGLSVNGVQLAGYFGGPPLLSRTAIYVPRYLDWERKFELCQISPVTRVITPILSPQYVIGLVKMKDGMLYFHRDIYRNSLSKLNLITGEAILAEIIRNRGSLVGITGLPDRAFCFSVYHLHRDCDNTLYYLSDIARQNQRK